MVVWSASMALGGLLALSFLPTAPKVHAHQHFREDGWVVAIQRDTFADRVHCSLRASNGQLRYRPGAIGFQASNRGTSNAWYRVDGGALVRWQDRTATLIASGVSIEGPALDNPTGGWVWIPIAEVRDAQQIWIRAGEHGRVRRFRMRGFAMALSDAVRLGCTSDASFQS